MKKVVNVVIVGAGPAGLTFAYELLKKSKDKYNVTILEQDDQVGGISKTISYHGNRMDLGGHRFFTKEKKIQKIWTDLLPIQNFPSYDDKKLNIEKSLPKRGKNPEKDDLVMLIRNRVSRIYYENKFYDYPVSINLSTIKNLGLFRTIECGFSYLKYKLFKKNEKNLEDFYINRFGKKLYLMFFKDYTKKVWGKDPNQISKDWGYQRVKGISISKVVIDYFKRIFHINQKQKEASLIESFYYPKYGPGQLYEEMAKKIVQMGGKIIKNSKVIKIDKNKNKIDKIIYQKNGKEYLKKVDLLISSMPIKDLVEAFDEVDEEVLDIAANLPYRDFITVGILVKKLSLENQTKIKTLNNNIPDCWMYIQDSDVRVGRIQLFNNWSPYMVKDVDHTTWLGLEYFCNEKDDFWNLDDSKIKQFAIDELKKLNIVDEDILDSCCIRVKKAYPAYFGRYQEIDKVKSYLNKIDNLYCIGRNGQHRYNNMDHSMMSAIVCVDHILKGKKNKEKLWDINTKSEYHEEIKYEKTS